MLLDPGLAEEEMEGGGGRIRKVLQPSCHQRKVGDSILRNTKL